MENKKGQVIIYWK